MNNNDFALLKLSYCPFIGPNKIKLLEKQLKNLNDIFSLSFNTLVSLGLSGKIATKFLAWKKSCSINKILSELENNKIKFISWHDNRYSKLLREIHSAPSILFYQGNIDILNKSHGFLSVVGARQASFYAQKIINEFLPPLIKNNILITSGLARGVDALAHSITLKNKGITCAVLGSGLKTELIYPPENLKLLQDIITNGGLVLSEFPPSEFAQKINFPRRNRIIAGLSVATLVVEAGVKSGSLITANFALENNRDILTIPANIFDKNLSGNNRLIQAGAIPILNLSDLMLYFNIEEKDNINSIDLATKEVFLNNDIENLIYNEIRKADQLGIKISSELLCHKIKLDTTTINSTLTILELKNIIIKKNNFWFPYY